jgi:predicted transcriptional regulator
MAKNITLAIDDDLLRQVRKYAAEHDTTVNAIVREKLAEVIAPKKRVADALKRMEAIADEAGMEVGPITWTRDDVYER